MSSKDKPVEGGASSMKENRQLDKLLNAIKESMQRILGENLTGIYVHGSIAFGCFNPGHSDIDFIVVAKEAPNPGTKADLIKALLEINGTYPNNGLEMSLVLEKYCREFVYPTPYELHFSNLHIHKALKDPGEFARTINGKDRDLAAHFTVIRETGITLQGIDGNELFGPVPRDEYLDSIKMDVENASEDILQHPTYVILNLCRVLAFIREGRILSKEQGGRWGTEHLECVYKNLVEQALHSYLSRISTVPDPGYENTEQLRAFADFMIGEIGITKDNGKTE